MEQVGCRVVAFGGTACLHIDSGTEGGIDVAGQLAGDVHGQVVLHALPALGRGEREQLTANVDLPQVVSAPVEEGQILGKVTFSVKDRVVGSCFLRAKQAVEKLSFSDMLLWMLSALARRPDTAANADLTNTGK